MSEKGACWRCRWFEPDPERTDDVGDCHRFPPQLGAGDDGSTVCWFPSVGYMEWCGEFEEGS